VWEPVNERFGASQCSQIRSVSVNFVATIPLLATPRSVNAPQELIQPRRNFLGDREDCSNGSKAALGEVP
jgi:hypothetical protein